MENVRRKNKITPNGDNGVCDCNTTASRFADCACTLSNDLMETCEIAIIGSGLAGLSTALSLEQVGYRRITIYERDTSFSARRDGYGLTLTYDPRGSLAALGVLDELAQQDCPSRSHYLLQAPTGRVRGYFGNAFYHVENNNTNSDNHKDDETRSRKRRGVGQRGNLRVPRQLVRKALMDRLQHSHIAWSHKLLDMVPSGDEMELVFDISTTTENAPTLATSRRTAQLVVAADGVNSRVVSCWLPRVPPPAFLGVRVIVGLSGYVHPLLDERGFYTVSPGVRLFVMPFAANRLDPVEERRFMWQLSFAANVERTGSDDEKEGGAENDSSMPCFTSQELWDEAWSICQEWHCPVPDMIQATPVSTVWGTWLCERDPVPLYRQLKEKALQRVIVVGDALHAMSMFKGQGANQALQDGRVVAQWLDPSSTARKKKTFRTHQAVKGCMRELTQRTQHVVHASRLASQFWHHTRYDEIAAHILSEPTGHEQDEFAPSSSCSSSSGNPKDTIMEMYREHFKFAGLSQLSAEKLLDLLQERDIRAGIHHNLDQVILEIILEQGLAADKDDDKSSSKQQQQQQQQQDNAINHSEAMAMDPDWVEQVWEATQDGNVGRLRRLSWEGQRKSYCISQVRDERTGQSVLHMAVQHEQLNVVIWLVREGGCLLTKQDDNGQSPWDLARLNQSTETLDLLEKLSNL